MQVLLHLFYNMFGLMEIVYLEVRRSLYYFMRMSALGAEFPFLEMVHVRKGTAGRAADDEVHGNDVMCFILLKIYRRFLSGSGHHTFLKHSRVNVFRDKKIFLKAT